MRLFIPAMAAAAAAGLGAVGVATTGLAAPPSFAALQGAWVEPSLSCGEVFVAKGKGLAFRQPANAFASAFIVSGDRLSTPLATCRIRAYATEGDRRALILSCANAVGTADVRAYISPTQDGALLRYLNEMDKTGSRYQRCLPQDVRGARP